MNLSQITSKLTPKGWLMVGGSAAGALIFMVLLFNMASAPSYTTMLAGVNPAQTGKITSALATQGISYEIQSNGTAIAVQSSQEAQARVALATAGLLSGTDASGGSALSSLNSSSSLGESDFQQQTAYQAALESQLESTIDNIQGVTSAQVLLVLPDPTDQLFASQSSAASASVLLNDSGSLATGAVKGIADLVAGSVSGLDSSKVTITDQTGAQLWPGSSDDGGVLSKQSSENSYDAAMAGSIDGMLAQTLGMGKAVVEVNADLDTDQTTQDSLTYTGKPVPLTNDTTDETLDGAGSTSGGVTGTSTNIPSLAASGSGGNSKYVDKSANVTNGVDKTVTHSVISPGAINQQSVAVLVSSKVPASELPAIKSIVTAAAGLNAKRGDTLSVEQIPFAKTPVVAPAASSPTAMLSYAKYGVVGLGALLFLFFVSRMLRKRENEQFAGEATWLRELESPRSLASVEAEQLDRGPVMQLRSPVNVAKQQVEDLVARDPDRVASQVRQWMTED